MPHDLAEYEPDLEPQASTASGGGPPGKFTGIGVLHPPRPPKRPLGPIPSAPTSLLWRIAAAVLLPGIAAIYALPAFSRALRGASS